MKKYLHYLQFVFLVFLFLNAKSGYSQFTFIHITDLHVSDGNPASVFGDNDLNGVEFNCCRKQFVDFYPKPAFVVATGDISNVGGVPIDGMYSALTRHLYPHAINNPLPGNYFIDLSLTIPIYFTPGNHEYYQVMVPPVILTTPGPYVENLSPDEDYAVKKDNLVLLMVRTGGDIPMWEGQNPFDAKTTGLTDHQCHWLRENLRNAGNKRKIIAMHHPVRNSSGILYSDSASSPLPDDNGAFMYNRATFMNICDSNHVDVVLIGHTHNNIVLNRGGYIVDENWTGGTRYVQTSAEVNGNYRLITVNPASVYVGRPSHIYCSDVENANSRTAVSLYPNPVTEMALLELHPDETIINFEMRIYSVQGTEVKRITGINSTLTPVERGNLKPGIYYFTVSDNQGLVKGKGKMSIGVH